MNRATNTVTEVGVGQIQFYIPHEVGETCVFNPGDEFEVRAIRGVGLLILDPEATPTVEDVVDVLDTE
jgi:hypothetical protein